MLLELDAPGKFDPFLRLLLTHFYFEAKLASHCSRPLESSEPCIFQETPLRLSTQRTMQLQSKYRSKIYRDFRAIGDREWRTIVRYYESCEEQILHLDFEEYFEILDAYTNALFETGAYEKHLLMADAVIEASVMNNVKFFKGEDVFLRTLFKKAASSFQLHDLKQSEHILRELLRIDPYDQQAALFLKKCLRKMHSLLVRQTRAVSILLFLLSALIICVELLVIRPFYPMLDQLVEISRNFIFLLGIVVLAGGDIAHRWQSAHQVDVFVEMLKKRSK